MANGKISSMIRATEEKPTDLFEISQEDASEPSGYVTRATTMSLIAGLVAEGLEFQNLTTAVKTLVGAINELANLRTFNSGDSVSFKQWTSSEGSANFGGFVTGQSKNIWIYIPLSKPVKATSCSITGSLAIRCSKGMANGSDSVFNLVSDTKVQSVKATPQTNGISLAITLNSSLTETVNHETIVASPSGEPLIIRFA